MKLYHLKAKVDDIVATPEDLFLFKAHVEENCTVCVPKSGKPFTKNVFDQHQVVDIAKKHCFSMSQEGKFKQFVLLENSNASIVSTKTITLLEGGYWEFKVNHLNLHQHPFALPDILNVNTGDFIFSVINKANICCGNPDFKDLVTWKIHPENFQSANGADRGIIQTTLDSRIMGGGCGIIGGGGVGTFCYI